MDTINENKATDYITAYYKEIHDEIRQLSSRENFAGILQAAVNFLKLLLTNGQIQKIGDRIKVMGWLHKRGNDYVKFIIENLFVRSFDGMKRRCTTVEWNNLYKGIPVALKKVYIAQNALA